jgi:hypothetical protein
MVFLLNNFSYFVMRDILGVEKIFFDYKLHQLVKNYVSNTIFVAIIRVWYANWQGWYSENILSTLVAVKTSDLNGLTILSRVFVTKTRVWIGESVY